METGTILDMDAIELYNTLEDNFTYEMPEDLETIEGLAKANKLISELLNAYAFISSMAAMASVYKRTYKNSSTKKEYEEMVDKEKILKAKADVLDKFYAGISRQITIKQMINKELEMGDKK